MDSYRTASGRPPANRLTGMISGRRCGRSGVCRRGRGFRQALAIDPDFADAYRNLAYCRQLAADEVNLDRLTTLVEHPTLPREERVIAGFALGKSLDDADRFDAAFAAYKQANETYREMRGAIGDRFDPEALHRQVDDTIAAYTPDFFASVATWAKPSELPVFIVGMPRSGTSLIEQIAASHSQVFGAGELKDIGKLSLELGACHCGRGPVPTSGGWPMHISSA